MKTLKLFFLLFIYSFVVISTTCKSQDIKVPSREWMIKVSDYRSYNIDLIFPSDGYKVDIKSFEKSPSLKFQWKWNDPGGNYIEYVSKVVGGKLTTKIISSEYPFNSKFLFHLIIVKLYGNQTPDAALDVNEAIDQDSIIKIGNPQNTVTCETATFGKCFDSDYSKIFVPGGYAWGIKMYVNDTLREMSWANTFYILNYNVLTIVEKNPVLTQPVYLNWSDTLMKHSLWLQSYSYFPQWEWMPITSYTSLLNEECEPLSIGVTGVVVNQDISGNDVPFTHPFGTDWEFNIIPDDKYTNFLAYNNTIDWGEYKSDFATASDTMKIPFIKGIMGIETDSGFIPDYYRAKRGDHVAVFGRWIIDAGHDSYHTEIHPPLLFVKAYDSSNYITHTTIISRPYLISQNFTHGTDSEGLFGHLLNQFKDPACMQLEAKVKLLAPFNTHQTFDFYIKPSIDRPSENYYLQVTYNLTVHSGITVKFMNETDSLHVQIDMDPYNYGYSELNAKHDHRLTVEELDHLHQFDLLNQRVGLGHLINGIIPLLQAVKQNLPFVCALLDLVPFIPPGTCELFVVPANISIDKLTVNLTNGIIGTYYDPPKAEFDISKNKQIQFSKMKRPTILSTNLNTNQPYPIYGFIDVEWKFNSSVLMTNPEVNSEKKGIRKN